MREIIFVEKQENFELRSKVLEVVSTRAISNKERDVTPGSTRTSQMDRKKTREECVGDFNLISTDTEFESKVWERRALSPNLSLFFALIFIAIDIYPEYLFII